MTLFQVINLQSPIQLTKQGEERVQKIIKSVKDVVEAIDEGLSVCRQGEPDFDHKVDRDLR